jgi:2-polyprenyl-3-methyl-5-hydroxy-6-metoxy-1,4-benzoquinol methylase/predicted RNA-binding Zn-ribbon protein involved in translation (DUF1610 family)
LRRAGAPTHASTHGEAAPGIESTLYICPLCEKSTVSRAIRFEGTTVRFCSSCGAAAVVEIAAKALYEKSADDYSTRYTSELLASKALACWGLVQDYVESQPVAQSLLDVGCGEGAFLELAKRAGLRTTGIDISSRAAHAAAQKGHKIFCSPVDEPPYPSDERFDIITMWDILEHLRQPLQALRYVFASLAPGGRLFILTPMMGSVYDRWGIRLHQLSAGRCNQLLRMCWDQNHLFRFSPAGTQRVLHSIGFAKVSITPILLLSLRADRYAGGNILQSWTGIPIFDKFISRAGVRLAKLCGLSNKLFIVAERGAADVWRSEMS